MTNSFTNVSSVANRARVSVPAPSQGGHSHLTTNCPTSWGLSSPTAMSLLSCSGEYCPPHYQGDWGPAWASVSSHSVSPSFPLLLV